MENKIFKILKGDALEIVFVSDSLQNLSFEWLLQMVKLKCHVFVPAFSHLIWKHLLSSEETVNYMEYIV